MRSKPCKDDFRWILRRDTQTEHDRLDGLISRLDITAKGDLAIFLRSHMAFFQSIPVQDRNQIVEDLIACLSADLASLDAKPMPSGINAMRRLDPLAVDYIVSGSRLGNEVLKKRWMNTQDASVRKAGRYFLADAEGGRWQQVCQALSSLDQQSPRAGQIKQDVTYLFERMTEIFRQASAAN